VKRPVSIAALAREAGVTPATARAWLADSRRAQARKSAALEAALLRLTVGGAESEEAFLEALLGVSEPVKRALHE
jgi:hypothetical protein